MLAPIMLGGFHKVAFLFCDHPRGTPQDKFFAEDAPFYRISGRVQVLKTMARNKDFSAIPDPHTGGAAGWNMIVGFSHYAEVFGNNS